MYIHRHKKRSTNSAAWLAAGLSTAALALCVAVALPLSPSVATAGSSTGRVVAYDRAAGTLRFVGTAAGSPIGRPAGIDAGASAAVAGRAFLDHFGTSFGIRNPARDLRVTSVRAVAGGRSIVRAQQLRGGIPVLGGELVLDLDQEENMLSAGAHLLAQGSTSDGHRIGPAAARSTARRAVAATYGQPAARLHTSTPRLWIYDSKLLGGPGLDRATLVWRMDVDANAGAVRELVLVDAHTGIVALHFNQVETARVRRICDAANRAEEVPCTSPVRTEDDPPGAVADVDDAYEFLGDTYDFYRTNFGRDSIDAAGMPLVATTRYCPRGGECPWPNAFWDGQQMVFGERFASADDVVGHELSHGVIDRTSKLFYYYQSGAINESVADVFGEFVDLANGAGTDTATARWKLGEDLPIGAIRDLADPKRFEQPDRMGSSYYTPDLGEDDNGGVHTNSGVGNKAAFLITDGGTFNGRTVTGLGLAKAARIYYEVATNLLTSASDYEDLYYALPQACRDLVGTAGITAGDCDQVSTAVSAVEMNGGGPSSSARTAPLCPGPGAPHDLFFDDLENPASGNWATAARRGVSSWYYPQNPNPYFDATYATSGVTNLFAADSTEISDSTVEMTHSVAIPAGEVTYLGFNHAYGFEDTGVNAHDGGVVEYSTDGGATWDDVFPLFVDNGYNGSITGGFLNPLMGRRAFVRESNGYGSSRAALAPLAGNAVRFRFRIGTGDGFAPDYGWFVDDIRIYTCPTHPPAAKIGGPSSVMSGKRGTWTFSAADALPGDQVGVFRYAIDWNGDGRIDTRVRRGGSVHLLHRYTAAGERRITATATDEHGFTGNVVAKTVKVRKYHAARP